MYVAPFGVGAAIAVTIGSKGIGVLFSLGKLVGALYLAQAAGIHMAIMTQFTMMLTSKGAAGVPRAAIVLLAATAATFQLPAEGITLILGVDALMDMGRTCVNVLGNCTARAVVSRWERIKLTQVAAETLEVEA